MIIERRREDERRDLRREQTLLRTQLNYTLAGMHQPKLAAGALSIDIMGDDHSTDDGTHAAERRARTMQAGSYERLVGLFGSTSDGVQL